MTARCSQGYTENSSQGFWALLSAVGAGVSAYHGYKRNEADNPIAWALWWGLWGAVVPVITIPVALAQGFSEPGP